MPAEKFFHCIVVIFGKHNSPIFDKNDDAEIVWADNPKLLHPNKRKWHSNGEKFACIAAIFAIQ